MSISVQLQDGPPHEAAARGDADALRAATAPAAAAGEIDEPGGRRGQRPLPCRGRHAEAARVLLAAGADAHALDGAGQSAARAARGIASVVRLLLGRGVPCDERDAAAAAPPRGRRPRRARRTRATRARRPARRALARRALLRAGADATTGGRGGRRGRALDTLDDAGDVGGAARGC